MFPPDSIPQEVVALCRKLCEAGYAAYVVGGAVRDLLRLHGGATQSGAKDFDVTTAAPPQEVLRLFGPRRTIPTGIAHGTVTVLCPRGEEERPMHVEVTTFRGEVGHTDGRRPDRVEFIADLTEDLRRRDFTINAIAYDPLGQTLFDPFDGQGDLRRQLIRAVGVPAQRFSEDGLRLLRAVRFAAQLGFAIDPATRAAFSGALPTLRKVSRERVRDELLKLLAAVKPSRGLVHMLEPTERSEVFLAESGLLAVVLPEVAAALTEAADPFAAGRWLALVDAVPAAQRLFALLWPLRGAAITKDSRKLQDRLDELLKLPSASRQHLSTLLGFADLEYGRQAPWPAAEVRRLMSRHPPEILDDYLLLRSTDLALRQQPEKAGDLAELQQRIVIERAQAAPVRTADLAVSGQELLQELGLRPGPMIGTTLRHLLEWVLDDPQRNQRTVLLAEAARHVGRTEASRS